MIFPPRKNSPATAAERFLNKLNFFKTMTAKEDSGIYYLTITVQTAARKKKINKGSFQMF
jgi:hypothetical protein